MTTTAVCCTKCQTVLQGDVFNLPGLTPCPNCGALLQIEIFPALFRRIAPGRGAEATVEETESSCFYHPQKKAVLPCDACGRFLCALCDCELDGQHFCPACLEAGRTKGKIKSLENKRSVHDHEALILAVISIIPYLGLLTGSLAMFISFRYLNRPGSLVRRSKVRYIAAIIIALMGLGVSVIVIIATLMG